MGVISMGSATDMEEGRMISLAVVIKVGILEIN